MKKHVDFVQGRMVIAFIIFMVLFWYLSLLVYRGVDQHYDEHVEDLSKHLAEGYKQSITNSYKTERIINQLIEDKLILVGELISRVDHIDTQEELQALAQRLDVDQVNVFNETGAVVLTSSDEYNAWQAYPEHPVMRLLQSDDMSYVENIREHAITGLRYKFGYYRLTNNQIIQVGVLAENILLMFVDLEIPTLLNNIKKENHILFATYYDEMGIARFSTENNQIGETLDLSFWMKDNTDYYHVKSNNIYVIYVPIVVDVQMIGFLSFGHNMQGQRESREMLRLIGMFMLLLIFGLIGFQYLTYLDKHKKLHTLAFYDKLTQTPNIDSLELSFKNLGMEKSQGYLVLINIHDFKQVNVQYGLQVGDKVLVKIAQRLQEFTDQNTQLFRFSGGRFVFLIHPLYNHEAIHKFSQTIIMRMNEPFIINHINIHVQVRMGIVLFTTGVDMLDRLLQKAILVTEKAQYDVSSSYHFYHHELEASVRREEAIRQEIMEVLRGDNSDRLSLVYQPLLKVRETQIYGFEALARFQSNSFGTIPAQEFIGIAEKYQLMFDLGCKILEKACAFRQELQHEKLKEAVISVNLSGLQLIHDDFVHSVREILDKTKLPPSLLELEITESYLISNYQPISDKLIQLRQMGIRIAIDDFGTGFSSLFRLHELQADTMKIDKAFIHQITNESNKHNILNEMIKMAHILSLTVVAEGVETQAQYEYLVNHACDVIQGFHYCMPLTPQALISFIEDKI
jgi:diguanylate cyclase (GGDEF)-like protein